MSPKSKQHQAVFQLSPVPLDKIQVAGFLGDRIEANVESLLAGVDSAIPEAFEMFAEGSVPTERGGSRLSDLFKWVEGAACVLMYDVRIESELMRMVDLIQRAMPGLQDNPAGYDDLYVAGHFFQAAIAYDLATRRTELLDLACTWADDLLQQDRKRTLKGVGQDCATYHPCIEMGLIQLSRRTGNVAYRDFAMALIHRHDVGETVGELGISKNKRHAVCVAYLLVALAESVLDTGDEDVFKQLNKLWEEMVRTRLYLAGGIGYGEHIPEFPYDLPQVMGPDEHKDIAETCASIGVMMLGLRLHQMTPRPDAFDVIENTLYNHFLGALSLDHRGIFYYNPLRLVGAHPKEDLDRDAYRRTVLPELHRTSCCFPNAWRFLARLPQSIASTSEDGIYIHLYTSCSFEHRLENGTSVGLALETDYPHDGVIHLTVRPSQPVRFTVYLRIPAWVERGILTVEDEPIQEVGGGSYLALKRFWQAATEVRLELEMPVRALLSRPEIAANRGQVAFARGPLIYCAEQADSEISVEDLCVSGKMDAILEASEAAWHPDFLGGCHVLRMPTFRFRFLEENGGWPYFNPTSQTIEMVCATMIPYYARANRNASSQWVTLIPMSQ